jgi:hypothetical protein
VRTSLLRCGDDRIRRIIVVPSPQACGFHLFPAPAESRATWLAGAQHFECREFRTRAQKRKRSFPSCSGERERNPSVSVCVCAWCDRLLVPCPPIPIVVGSLRRQRDSSCSLSPEQSNSRCWIASHDRQHERTDAAEAASRPVEARQVPANARTGGEFFSSQEDVSSPPPWCFGAEGDVPARKNEEKDRSIPSL